MAQEGIVSPAWSFRNARNAASKEPASTMTAEHMSCDDGRSSENLTKLFPLVSHAELVVVDVAVAVPVVAVVAVAVIARGVVVTSAVLGRVGTAEVVPAVSRVDVDVDDAPEVSVARVSDSDVVRGVGSGVECESEVGERVCT